LPFLKHKGRPAVTILWMSPFEQDPQSLPIRICAGVMGLIFAFDGAGPASAGPELAETRRQFNVIMRYPGDPHRDACGVGCSAEP
jgi:hypothetical protein